MGQTSKVGFFTKVINWCNCIVALLLLVAFVIPYTPPASFPTISLLSLAVSPLILLNILFVVYWLIRRKRRALLSLSVLICGYFFFNPFIEFSTEGDSDAYQNTLSILSYNVRLFNAYEENTDKDVSEIISEILNTNKPDVFCIQEYYHKTKLSFPEYPYQYVHFKKTINKKGEERENILGHAILSKFPIVNKGAFDFKKTYNNSIYADVVKGKDTIRVYNLHLKSLGILPKVSYLQDGDTDKLRERMSDAFIGQEEQLKEVLQHKDTSPYPVLLCGDFNNTPFSYVYRIAEKGMKDAFIERGNGLGTTYMFQFYPIRIDYVFASEEFEVLKFNTIKKSFSDHYPITATVGWNSANRKD
jgi:endonuclease/exonuclease/phosphatase family metal-dependent hydrolase